MMDVSPVKESKHMGENCAHVHEWIIDRDDEDLSRAFQGQMVEIAWYVRLRARRA